MPVKATASAIAVAIVAFAAPAQAAPGDPQTMFTVTSDAAELVVQAPDCNIDLDCRSLILACSDAALQLVIRNLDEATAQRWLETGAPAGLVAGSAEISLAPIEAANGGAWRWSVMFAADGDTAAWLAALRATPASIELATPDFTVPFDLTDADRWHAEAFATACLGEPGEPNCPLSEAHYVGDGGTITFAMTEPPQLTLLRGDNAMTAVHTGASGRGANFHERASDRFFAYWFDGAQGVLASLVADGDPAALTFSLEGVGDFRRVCP